MVPKHRKEEFERKRTMKKKGGSWMKRERDECLFCPVYKTSCTVGYFDLKNSNSKSYDRLSNTKTSRY